MSFKYIVFDIDGTLLNTKQAFLGALEDALLKLNVSHGDLSPYFSLPLSDAIRDFDLAPDVVERWEQDYAMRLSDAPLYDGVKEMLTTLSKNGITMGLVTSRKHAVAAVGLKENGVLPLFEVIIAADDVTHPKPAPEPLETYCKFKQCTPKDFCYIGDSTVDAECAKNAGVQFFAPGWAQLSPVLEPFAIDTAQLISMIK